MVIEVRDIVGQHGLKVAPVKDQHAIQQLSAEGADPSSGDRVRLVTCL
jgi:hypothetical protein